MRPRVIFFDAGGTLVYPAKKIGAFYAEVGAEFGQAFDPVRVNDGFKAAFRSRRPRDPQTIPTHGDDRAWWRQVVIQALEKEALTPDFDFDAFYEVLYRRFENPSWWRLFEDVLPTLTRLREQGTRLAVLSNWDARLHPILDGLGIGGFFEKRWISAELGFEKPNPQIYHHVCTAMGIQPQEAMLVGDDLENDHRAPQALGLQTFFVDRPTRGLEQVLRDEAPSRIG